MKQQGLGNHRNLAVLAIWVSLLLVLWGGLSAWLQPEVLPAKAAPQVGSTQLNNLNMPGNRPKLLPDIQLNNSQLVVSGFNRPVQVTNAGDGSGRLFVPEEAGLIKLVKNGATLGTPFLDLRDRVEPAIVGDQRGFHTLAFPPDYASKGHFYVFYTDTPTQSVISRFRITANPDVADPDSEQVILRITMAKDSGFQHKGGALAFNPLDGYLYANVGDGGNKKAAQDKNFIYGKLIRLDVETGNPLTYTIPPGNPYTQTVNARPEIWASGLRNPWRLNIDRLTGDLFIGDVGEDTQEEISYQAGGTPGGLNFGWYCREGLIPGLGADVAPCNNPGYLAGLTDPIIAYNHAEGNVTSGGLVYRGVKYPNMFGRFIYADFGSGQIWSIYKEGDTWSTPEEELETHAGLVLGEGDDGELYTLGLFNGQLRRLIDTSKPGPKLTNSTKSASTPHADLGEVVTYTIHISNTGDRDNRTLFLTDVVPSGLSYNPGTLAATQGTVDDSQSPILRWQGALTPVNEITLTYRVTVVTDTGSLLNHAQITGSAIQAITLSTALAIPRPVVSSTLDDFFLPGTQPGINTPIPVNGCEVCHTAPIYESWRGSMMSHAGQDPLMWAALFIANNDVPGAGDYCLRCHTPKGWLEDRSHPSDGSQLEPDDLQVGVACEVCHRMVDPKPSPNDEAVAIDANIRAALTSTVPISNVGNGMMIVDQLDRRRGPFSLNPQPPHGARQTDFLGQSGNAVTESRLCGTCHNVSNPVLSWDEGRQQYWPNEEGMPAPQADLDNGRLFPIERTYDEWLNSTYAKTGVYAPQFAGAKPDGMVASCQDCHMLRSTGKAASGEIDGVQRDCQTTGCLPEHIFAGGNAWVPQILQDSRWRLNSSDEAAYLDKTTLQARAMLQKAATLTATLVTSGSNKLVKVQVINETGHKLPTGYPEGRRMWLNLQAFDASGKLIYQSGAYSSATAVLTHDAAIKIYETKLGLTPELAQLVNKPAGESFHFVLNNTILKDNRIPPRGYTQAAFNKPGLRPVGATYLNGQYWDETTYTVPTSTVKINIKLFYQTSSKEYIDFLRSLGGADGNTLGQLWDTLKSPPELMAQLQLTQPTVPPDPTPTPTPLPKKKTYLPVLFKR